jgi:aromatic ring-opening dioxygenase LigB subunit
MCILGILLFYIFYQFLANEVVSYSKNTPNNATIQLLFSSFNSWKVEAMQTIKKIIIKNAMPYSNQERVIIARILHVYGIVNKVCLLH